MRRIAVLDAPSNLGLRPPTATSVPGCAKAPGALRDHGLLARLGARDAGCVTPGRYDPAGWRPGDGVAQSDDIAHFTRRLADRIGGLLAAGEFPLVLGGDCSILLAAGLAMRRHASTLNGHIGLIYVDGHSDFRHQGNASYVGAAAGEALALVTGRGQSDLSGIEHRRPYFRDVDVALLGIRTHDEYRLDLQAAGIAYRAVPEVRSDGAARSAQWARQVVGDCVGFWVHVDVDVLDPAVMPAVDAPDAGGIAYAELELLLAGLVATPKCLGVQVTVFDPDYDPEDVYAREVAETLIAGLGPLIVHEPPPAAVVVVPAARTSPDGRVTVQVPVQVPAQSSAAHDGPAGSPPAADPRTADGPLSPGGATLVGSMSAVRPSSRDAVAVGPMSAVRPSTTDAMAVGPAALDATALPAERSPQGWPVEAPRAARWAPRGEPIPGVGSTEPSSGLGWPTADTRPEVGR